MLIACDIFNPSLHENMIFGRKIDQLKDISKRSKSDMHEVKIVSLILVKYVKIPSKKRKCLPDLTAASTNTDFTHWILMARIVVEHSLSYQL